MTSLLQIMGLWGKSMNNKPKTKLLTISLLCCGRPDTTERCLKSLMPIREAIDSEIQVVDTGCSKETRAIICARQETLSWIRPTARCCCTSLMMNGFWIANILSNFSRSRIVPATISEAISKGIIWILTAENTRILRFAECVR